MKNSNPDTSDNKNITVEPKCIGEHGELDLFLGVFLYVWPYYMYCFVPVLIQMHSFNPFDYLRYSLKKT